MWPYVLLGGAVAVTAVVGGVVWHHRNELLTLETNAMIDICVGRFWTRFEEAKHVMGPDTSYVSSVTIDARGTNGNAQLSGDDALRNFLALYTGNNSDFKYGTQTTMDIGDLFLYEQIGNLQDVSLRIKWKPDCMEPSYCATYTSMFITFPPYPEHHHVHSDTELCFGEMSVTPTELFFSRWILTDLGAKHDVTHLVNQLKGPKKNFYDDEDASYAGIRRVCVRDVREWSEHVVSPSATLTTPSGDMIEMTDHDFPLSA